MPKQPIQPEAPFPPPGQYTPAIESDGLVFLSGQVPFDAAGKLVSEDFATQARQVFENMNRCLRAAGCEFADVLKVTGFLADMNDAKIFNEIYGEYFAAPYPARSTVQVVLPDFKLEVEAIARRPVVRPPANRP
jgi:2-iminobutanoate/2-iminopropanoate deaminase